VNEQQAARAAARRLAILRHAEEITGNVARTCRYYGISRQIDTTSVHLSVDGRRLKTLVSRIITADLARLRAGAPGRPVPRQRLRRSAVSSMEPPSRWTAWSTQRAPWASGGRSSASGYCWPAGG
jgi:hypothetical protein